MESRIREYIKTWEGRCYPEGIPDAVPDEIADKVPTYKRICLAILRNDIALKSLGYQAPKSAVYNAIKHEEIKNRKNMAIQKDDRPKLTDMESNTLSTLKRYTDGLLRRYTDNQFRLQDAQINPIINISKNIIDKLVDKEYLKLQPEHKFELL